MEMVHSDRRFSPAQIAKERKATAALNEWLTKVEEVSRLAEDVSRLYAEAEIPLPPSLADFLGDTNRSRQPTQPRIIVTAPEPPPPPPEAESNWIWVPFRELSPQTAILGWLRQQQTPQKLGEIVKAVEGIIGGVQNERSIANIGPRLDGYVLHRTAEGWKLFRHASAPVLHEGHGWGPPHIFSAQEQAAHRRMLITHVLRAAGPKGLKRLEIVRRLEDSDFCHVPFTRDTVRDDLAALETEKKARRIGNSTNWILVD